MKKPDENKRYDRFRNRIMFPIRDTRGRTIAFGGRVLGDDKPKYLNSPETPVFHKGRELYGLYEATQSPGELKQVVVVEGYMDVVALAQYDINNAVATLGTAITGPHLEKLFRYTPEVVFCFDGDRAGRQAAHRALENCLPMMEDGRSARFLFLPDGEDPDSLVREIGAERFNDRLDEAQPLSKFLFDTAADGIDTSSPDGKARLAKNAAPYINTIPANIFRELMIGELATITGMNADKLEPLISSSDKLASAQPASKPANQPANSSASNQATPAETGAMAHEPVTGSPVTNLDASQFPPDYSDSMSGPLTESMPSSMEEPPPWLNENDSHGSHSAPAAKRISKMQLTAERTAIAILLNNTHLAQTVEGVELFVEGEDSEVQLLGSLVEYLQKNPDTSSHQILGHWLGMHRDGQGTLLAEIAACDTIYPPEHSERDNAAEFQDALNLIQRRTMRDLPLEQQVRFLAGKSHPNEEDIKAAFKILPEALRSDLSDELKTQLNQLIRRKK